MRRDRSFSLLPGANSPTSASASSERFCNYKKLNLVAFGGTLVYIGYICGRAGNGGDAAANGRHYLNSNDRRAQLRASSDDVRASASWDRVFEQQKPKPNEWPNREEVSSADVEEAEEERPITYAKGPVIYEHKGKATTISLIGERHSGTNWITNHLQDCFGDQIPVETHFTRYKHWFQFDDATVRNDSAVVISMFRDPYDWVEAMHEEPHHAHEHIDLDWQHFVSKPWVGARGPADQAKMEQAKREGVKLEKAECLAGYKFDEVIPCSPDDSVHKEGYSEYMYELKHDESARAYGSIIELRTAKILNFLQVPKFHGVKAFFPERYEALNLRGTADFLAKLEEVTGLKAKCEPFPPTGVVKHKDVDPEFTKWMNKYHDWHAESLIGYVKRDPVPRKNVPPPPQLNVETPAQQALDEQQKQAEELERQQQEQGKPVEG